MDGCPLGLGLVVEDKPTEFSCLLTNSTTIHCVCVFVELNNSVSYSPLPSNEEHPASYHP